MYIIFCRFFFLKKEKESTEDNFLVKKTDKKVFLKNPSKERKLI